LPAVLVTFTVAPSSSGPEREAEQCPPQLTELPAVHFATQLPDAVKLPFVQVAVALPTKLTLVLVTLVVPSCGRAVAVAVHPVPQLTV
jgi:hypothetical protein